MLSRTGFVVPADRIRCVVQRGLGALETARFSVFSSVETGFDCSLFASRCFALVACAVSMWPQMDEHEFEMHRRNRLQ